MEFDAAEQGQQGLDLFPDPNGDVFGGRVFQSGDIIDQPVIQLVNNSVHDIFEFFEVHDPAKLWVGRSFDVDLELIGMTVHIAALMSFGYIGEEVC